MFSWLWLLTCWSWGLAARWCGPLGLCRGQTGRSPLMPVAPCSRPGSSETGTWYQSCRCQKTLDLKMERSLCYSLEGFCEAISIPWRRKNCFLLPIDHREVRARGQLQNSTPLLTETSVGWLFAEELIFCTLLYTSLQLVFPLTQHKLGPDLCWMRSGMLRLACDVFLSTGKFISLWEN